MSARPAPAEPKLSERDLLVWELLVKGRPFDVKPRPDRTFQPDLVVVRSADLDDRTLGRPAPLPIVPLLIVPLLIVEVRSHSSGLYDRTRGPAPPGRRRTTPGARSQCA